MDGNPAYLLAAVTLLGVAATVAIALRRMWKLDEAPDLSLLDDSPEEKYAALGRLFSKRDLEFLRQQPGYTSRLEADFRRKRAQVFRMYLHSMQRDFRAIHSAARLMAAQGTGGPELSGQLITLPLQFRRTLLLARWQVWFYARGWSAPSIAIRPAIDAMFQLRGYVDLSAVASAA